MAESMKEAPLPAGLILSPENSALFRRLRLPSLAYLARVALLLVIYFSTAKLGLKMDAVSGFASTVWPPTGISLAALSLFGYGLWPGVALGALLVNVSAGAPLLTACGMALGNTLEALLGAYLLRRFAGFRGSLDRIQSVFAFVVLTAGLSTMVSATIGVASGYLGGVFSRVNLSKAWSTWWLGDAMGDLILAPLLFTAWERPRVSLTRPKLAEAGMLFGSLLMVSLLVFGALIAPRQTGYLQPFVLFPFLIWAALRFGQPGTSTTTFMVASVAVGMTYVGRGPFALGGVNDSLLLLQAFMGITAVTMLVLSAGVAERLSAERRLRLNYSVARALAEAPTLEDGLPEILRVICENLGWDCGNAWRVDTGANALVHVGFWHCTPGRLEDFGRLSEGVTFSPGVGLAGRVWSEARPIWVPDLAREENFLRGAQVRELGLQSAMGFPIRLGEEVLGVMTFLSRRIHKPDEAVLQMMATIGSQIGQFIQRRKAESDLKLAHAELEARIAHRTAQLSETNRELQEEISERQQVEGSLRELSTRLLRVQDEERKRLARELHDSTAQNLAALSMNLAVTGRDKEALDERSRVALEESLALAERCSREIRSLSYLLHPPLLEEVGLSAALRWLVDGFSRRSGISVELGLPENLSRLPVEVENALFRIAQECLTNVQRHSGSSRAWIRIARGGGGVSLEAWDEGSGIPAEILDRRRGGVKSLGVGLLGMRERVRQLGGTLELESSREGAMVRVAIPIPLEKA